MAGVKESKEMLVGINEVALYLVTRLKDGIGVDDLLDLVGKLNSDKEFMAKITAAYEGLDQIGDELGDLDLGEGLELAKVQLDYIPKYMEAAAKKG